MGPFYFNQGKREMIKQTITYVDFNGNKQSEDFYFNLTKPELVELEVSQEGGLGKWLEAISASGSRKEIIEQFKKIILLGYGRKSEDGKRFIKTQAMRDEFESHAAFSVLFMMLAEDAEFAAKFIKGVVPRDLDEEADQDKPQGPPPLPTTLRSAD